MRINQVSKRITEMQKIALTDMLSARILWNLNFYRQASWLIYQSAEKYIKVLWAQDKTIRNVSELSESWRNMGHNLKGMFNALSVEHKRALERNKFTYHDPATIRYGEPYNIGYSKKNFRKIELFINDVRRILGEHHNGYFDEAFEVVALSFNANKQRDAEKLLKNILSLKRSAPSRRQRKRYKNLLDLI